MGGNANVSPIEINNQPSEAVRPASIITAEPMVNDDFDRIACFGACERKEKELLGVEPIAILAATPEMTGPDEMLAYAKMAIEAAQLCDRESRHLSGCHVVRNGTNPKVAARVKLPRVQPFDKRNVIERAIKAAPERNVLGVDGGIANVQRGNSLDRTIVNLRSSEDLTQDDGEDEKEACMGEGGGVPGPAALDQCSRGNRTGMQVHPS